MRVRGHLYGGAALVRKLQAGVTVASGGITLACPLEAGTDIGMVQPILASTAAQVQAGVSEDASGTIAATGVSREDILVSVNVRPDAIIRGRMSGSSTAGTALTANPTTGASATGVVTTGVTTIDDGGVYGYDGANMGELRRADDNAGSLSMAMPSAIALGDNFLVGNGYPFSGAAAAAGDNLFFDFTTDLLEIDAATDVGDMDNFVCFDMFVQVGDDALSGSYYELCYNDHMLGANAQRS